jgi:hypothetical protein
MLVARYTRTALRAEVAKLHRFRGHAPPHYTAFVITRHLYRGWSEATTLAEWDRRKKRKCPRLVQSWDVRRSALPRKLLTTAKNAQGGVCLAERFAGGPAYNSYPRSVT